MDENRRRREAIESLRVALETDDGAEKNYHVRQALQLLELNDESDSDVDRGRRDP